uniref:Venom polypeptide n=1 Tax=Dolopus genitalis TaxID=2488630 RepID=A0A3G5BID8_DOLGE|nr:venom polypeptide [Dolopus genitalis]
MANFLNIIFIIAILCAILFGTEASFRCSERGEPCFLRTTLNCCSGVSACIKNQCRF